MEYRRLGRTELDVSTICLGTMTWGEQNTEAEGHAQMDYALDRGVNFLDTAEMYPIAPRRETAGRTEEIIGSWFAARRNRDKVILATKISGPSQAMNWFNEDGSPRRHNAAQIREAVDKSLKRLQTDYIDLYQLHWPDRRVMLFGRAPDPEQPETPVEETLRALEDVVKAGKVRYIGLSNDTAWGAMEFLRVAEREGLPRVQSIQNVYNLLSRAYDLGLAEVSLREDVPLLAYSPLAQGYLTGKYMNGALPQGSRKQLFDRLQRYEGPGADEAVTAYVALAREHGLDPAQMAIKFCMTRPFVTSTIIGATSMEQLKTDIDAKDIELPEAVMKSISAIHRRHPNPAL
ncbi:MAG: NADP(H)-dependent aldo-keto reductase [Alphaproteobacteria bacterium]